MSRFAFSVNILAVIRGCGGGRDDLAEAMGMEKIF